MADALLDFDSAEALEGDVVTVRRGGQEWRLRDDVRASLMIQMLRLSKIEQALNQALYKDMDPDAAEGFQQELETRTLRMVAACFQHSYPAMTEDEVARLFPLHVERERILMAFFTDRGSGSSAPANGAPPTSAELASMTTMTSPTGMATGIPANRAARRARAKAGEKVKPAVAAAG